MARSKVRKEHKHTHLKFDGPDPIQTAQVKEYQETGNQQIFNKLYNDFKPIIDAKLNMGRSYLDADELYGQLNERFIWCINNFNCSEDASFTGYVLMYFNYDFKTTKNRKHRDEVGGVIYYKGENGKYRKRMDWDSKAFQLDGKVPKKEGSRNETSMSEFFEGKESNYEKLDSNMDLQRIVKQYNIPDRVLQIIDMTLEGYTQAEIGNELDVSQSRVSIIISKMQKKYPEFSQALKEYLYDRMNKN